MHVAVYEIIITRVQSCSGNDCGRGCVRLWSWLCTIVVVVVYDSVCEVGVPFHGGLQGLPCGRIHGVWNTWTLATLLTPLFWMQLCTTSDVWASLKQCPATFKPNPTLSLLGGVCRVSPSKYLSKSCPHMYMYMYVYSVMYCIRAWFQQLTIALH